MHPWPSVPPEELKKSLYSLHQAPRCRFSKFTTASCECAFTQSYADYSLFTYHHNSAFCVLIFFEELLITGNSLPCITKFKAYLQCCFHMKDLGPLKYFLGTKVTQNSSSMYLCQWKYTLEIISETGLIGAKPAVSPSIA